MPDTSFPLFISCAKGQEDLINNELTALELDDVQIKMGGVSCTATLKQSLQICLWSRIAARVLLSLKAFDAEDETQLYNELVDFPWSDVIDVTQSFAVDCKLNGSNITHSKFAALRTKDAIVDYFRQQQDQRPNVETQQPELQFSLYINRNQATLYLDLSGESLHKRGYRVSGERAPLKENLAAAILMRCKWPERAREKQALVDPMCGSGTLLIEAALIASNTAPGLNRTYYGFLGWKKFDASLWQSILANAKEQQDFSQMPSITGYDNDKHAIYSSKQNIQAAQLDEYIHIERREIDQASPRLASDRGIIVVNPPYGERIGESEELSELYSQMGEQFKNQFLHWDAFVFTNSETLGKAIPLRAYKSNSLYNGALACKLLHFHIEPNWFFEASDGFRYIPLEARDNGCQMFSNRLQKNLRHLRKWAKRENIDCYRVYDADMPEYAIAIDLYQSEQILINVQEYEAPKDIPEKVSKKRLNDALSTILDVFAVEKNQIYWKTRKQQKGLAQYEKQEQNVAYHIIHESNLQFLVSLNNYLDTGIFLDHRKTRRLIADLAYNKSFLNLFCYTGAASVYAAQGGATSTLSVDMSKTYLNWAKRNFSLNQLTDDNYLFEQADCLQWIKQCEQTFDLIFLDPPSFSNSKRMDSHFSVQDNHETLIQDCMQLLDKNGILIFSNNYRRFKMSALVMESFNVENISNKTLPEDFKRNPNINNCWKITHKLVS